MTSSMITILDIDDGPDGGGGAALLQALRRRGVASRGVAGELLVGGLQGEPADVEFADLEAWLAAHDDMPGRLVAGTRRAVGLMSGIDGPESTLARWEQAREAALAVPPFALIEKTPDRDNLEETFAASHLLSDDGALSAVTDGGAAWLALKRLANDARLPALLVGVPGARLVEVACVVGDGRLLASAAVRIDAVSKTGRVGQCRSLDGKRWRRFARHCAELIEADGFHRVRCLDVHGQSKPRFVDAMAMPPDWLAIAGEEGGELVDAFLGRGSEDDAMHLAAGITYVAVPVDAPLPLEVLSRRMTR